MEKSWNFITGLHQWHKINAAKWLEWQMFYTQESILSEQAINTAFVNILLLEDSTAWYYKVEKNGTRVTMCSEQVVISEFNIDRSIKTLYCFVASWATGYNFVNLIMVLYFLCKFQVSGPWWLPYFQWYQCYCSWTSTLRVEINGCN